MFVRVFFLCVRFRGSPFSLFICFLLVVFGIKIMLNCLVTISTRFCELFKLKQHTSHAPAESEQRGLVSLPPGASHSKSAGQAWGYKRDVVFLTQR